ncbi:hypothetical protein ACHAXR_010898 [Thalassiosira sp. AJA248-18]
MSSNDEFTIRVTGAAPFPLPSTAKSKKGGGRGKAKKDNAAQQQQQRRYNLRLRPSSTLDRLRTDVFALFNVPSGSIESYRLSFLGGFPPKELNPEGKLTVHELGIRPNESLIVKFISLTNNDAKGGGKATKEPATKYAAAKEPEPSAVSNTGRQKRASAMAATANFRDIIAAQDAILKKEKKSPKKKGGGSSGFGNINKRIVASADPATALSKVNKRPKKVEMEGAGYRLSDGKSFAGSPSKKSRVGGKKQQSMFESKDDIANTLLSSLGGNGKGGNGGKFLRAAMRGAVAKSYEASRAAVRVAAVNQGDFSFEKIKGGSKVDGGGVVLGVAKDHEAKTSGDETDDAELGRTLYTVAYSKGMEGRGSYEEQVEIIGLAAVKAVLESVYNTASSNDPDENDSEENADGDKDSRLRPVLIAQLSPRVFWSLVYHCSEAAKRDENPTQSSVEDMLRSTLPQLDWSHLDRGGRKRVLSEKARENLRQEKQPKIEPTSKISSQDEEELGAKVIEEIGESVMNALMPSEGDDQELNERERRARAAMARFGNVSVTKTESTPASLKNDLVDDWTLVTPIEEDIDELIECILAGTSEEQKNSDEGTAKAWAGTLLGSVPNWRVLANSNAEDILSKLTYNTSSVPSSDTIEKWIDAAQERALEEIMISILDGDQDALEALVENARSSSPRDLKRWQPFPGLLLEALSGKEETNIKWEKSDVMRWISRAKTALSVCTWLEAYSTAAEPRVATW